MRVKISILIIFLISLVAIAQQSPCGIGAFVFVFPPALGGRLQIVTVASNSPAAQGGLMQGQIILAIDGISTEGLTLADCVKRIQGKAGTKVVLTIGDRQKGWTNSIELTREVVAGDPLSSDSKEFEPSTTHESKSVSVTTNQVARIQNKNGEIAVIQFMQFGITNASYRWRFRSASGDVSSGVGTVFENYERHIDAFGVQELKFRDNGESLYVKAGNIKLEWSKGGSDFAWLYYYPAKEKFEILDTSAFDSKLTVDSP